MSRAQIHAHICFVYAVACAHAIQCSRHIYFCIWGNCTLGSSTLHFKTVNTLIPVLIIIIIVFITTRRATAVPFIHNETTRRERKKNYRKYFWFCFISSLSDAGPSRCKQLKINILIDIRIRNEKEKKEKLKRRRCCSQRDNEFPSPVAPPLSATKRKQSNCRRWHINRVQCKTRSSISVSAQWLCDVSRVPRTKTTIQRRPKLLTMPQ